MKKILFLLLIILISCETSEVDNELAGTEWIYTTQYEYTHIDKSKYRQVYNEETGLFDTVYEQVTKTMNDTVIYSFISNNSVTYYFHSISTDGKWGTDPSTDEMRYSFNNNKKTGSIYPTRSDVDVSGNFRVIENKMYISWPTVNNGEDLELTKK